MTNAAFPHVSRPLRLRAKTLRSRVYLPAHQPGLADDGLPGERCVAYHRERARAGLGMQITGATPVNWSEVWADGLTLDIGDAQLQSDITAAVADAARWLEPEALSNAVMKVHPNP